jgi:hypothetical protein
MLPVGLVATEATPQKHTFLISSFFFLLGIFIATFWFTEGTVPQTPTTAKSSDTGIAKIITVSDQQAGAYVIVDSVDVPAPGAWVAVKEIVGDQLGNVLGANSVTGPAKNVTVNLLRSSLPGQSYAVVLYRDDGDGEFDVHKDSAYVDFDSGKSVIAYFKALP